MEQWHVGPLGGTMKRTAEDFKAKIEASKEKSGDKKERLKREKSHGREPPCRESHQAR